MRRSLPSISLAFFLFPYLVSSHSLQAVTYSLTYDDFPKTAFGCKFEAIELGERLKASGAKVKSSRCYRESSYSNTYSLRVAVDTGLTLARTGHYSDFHNGWYADLESCELDLPNQVQYFQLSTGLDPFISYCAQNGYYSFPYWPRIEAVGTSDMQLNSSVLAFGYSGNVDLEEVEKQISLSLNEGPRRLAFLRRDSSSLLVGYYSIESEFLDALKLFTFKTLADCEENRDVVRKIFSSNPGAPLALVCAESSYGSSSSALVSVDPGGRRELGTRLNYLGDSYTTKADCVANLDQVMTDSKNTGQNPLGAICIYENDYYGRYYSTVTFHKQ